MKGQGNLSLFLFCVMESLNIRANHSIRIMKSFKQFLSEETTLKFIQDNPGGSWLDGKREDAEHHKKNDHGAPRRFGTVTGYFNRKVLLPVSLVSKFKGIQGEQSNVRQDSLEWLVKNMKETGMLPTESGKQYAPFITVDQTGEPWVNEGNHRIMAAKKLGWEFMPVEVRYFNGGEDEPGPLEPKDAIKYDSKARAEGFEPDDNFKATEKEVA